jgi:glycine/D-amino acid oxidase-like deaminating enzyme
VKNNFSPYSFDIFMVSILLCFFSMDLRSHYPYWLLRHGIVNSYPSLHDDINTGVAIIGAGISGSLVAWYLCNAGFNVVIVDRRHAGMGSTAANTALLQYEIDTPLYKLINMVGEKNAVRSYLLCREAIYKVEDICRQLNDPSLFCTKPSFQFASFKKDIGQLQKEYELRKKAGFSIRFMDQKTVLKKFGLHKQAGLLSDDGAEADAYKITHLLLKKCIELGSNVYDNTEIKQIIHHRKGVKLITANGKKINARYLVIACGYESQRYISKRVEQLHSTYAIASEPFAQKNFWYKNSLIWETSLPYLYMRTTDDNRIIAGGKDIPYSDPFKRDELLAKKAKSLETAFKKLFPEIDFKTDFKWAGTFGYTRDGLPFIGTLPERPNTFFSLGFGGNGTTFSVIAGEIIRDMLSGKKNDDAKIFSFSRV